MKNVKLLLILFFFLLISCTKKSQMKDILIASKDYYWQLSNTCYDRDSYNDINYIRFEEDGYSHQYDFNVKDGYVLNEGNGGDNIVDPKRWYVKKDSILVWGSFEYKIEHIDHTVIVLTYFKPDDKQQKCSIRLLKVVGEK